MCYHCPHAISSIQLLKHRALRGIQLLAKPNTNDLFSQLNSVCFEKRSSISCVIAIFYVDGSEIHFKSFTCLLSALIYFLDNVTQNWISVFCISFVFLELLQLAASASAS